MATDQVLLGEQLVATTAEMIPLTVAEAVARALASCGEVARRCAVLTGQP
ncbi:hypothetical protein [Ferrimicrobium sp.]|nr:hypothetical protein [Ferrimicrobium sp.]